MSLTYPTKKGQPVNCRICNHEFPQDPILEVDCPDCGAPKGVRCRRPSGHGGGSFVAYHAIRDVLALKNGFYDHESLNGKYCGPASGSRRAKEIANQYGL